jgi:hypothetical protein
MPDAWPSGQAAGPLEAVEDPHPHTGWKVDEVVAEWAAIAAEQLAAWLSGRLPAAEVLGPAAGEVPGSAWGGLARRWRRPPRQAGQQVAVRPAS